jgi:hypothetical protein
VGGAGEKERYFLCRNPTRTELYRWVEPDRLVLLGHWNTFREWGAITDAGVIVRGVCAPEEPKKSEDYAVCAVTARGRKWTIGGGHDPHTWFALVASESQALAFEPGHRGQGTLHFYGARTGSVRVSAAESGPEQAPYSYVPEVSHVDGAIVGYVRHGQGVQGYRLALDGTLTWGKSVEGTAFVVTSGTRAFAVNSSGTAQESLDSGMSWTPAWLPEAVLSSLPAHPDTNTTLACTSVGCILGDWLRLGYAEAAHSGNALPPRSEPLAPPPLRGLDWGKHRVVRLVCSVDGKRTVTYEPSGKRRLAAPRLPEPERFGRTQQRPMERVVLQERTFFLGGAPEVGLFEQRGQAVRLVRAGDPRAALGRSRLRLVSDQSQTYLGYLVSSLWRRNVAAEWYVYPIDVESGVIEAPIPVPIDDELRACAKNESGWFVESELDEFAVVDLWPNDRDAMGVTRAELRAFSSSGRSRPRC